MSINAKEYDIEVQEGNGKWYQLDDVISLSYNTSTLLAGDEPIQRVVDSVEIDCILDGCISALIYKADKVNLIKKRLKY